MEKAYLWLLLLAIAGGLGVSSLSMAGSIEKIILPLLILLLFFTFLPVPLSEIRNAFQNRSFVIISLTLNFIITPFLAWGIGAVFLSDAPLLWLGFLLLVLTPCTDWYIVFTGIAKGNTAASVSLLPVNLMLQLLLLPVWMLLFGRVVVGPEILDVIPSVLLVLLIPFAAAFLVRRFVGSFQESLMEWVQVLILCIVIFAMFASQGEVILGEIDQLLRLIIPLLLFFVSLYWLGKGAAAFAGLEREDRISLHMTTIARNSPLVLAVVLAVFPDQPLLALVLVVGPLIELPLLAALSFVLKRG
ncbi:arsenic resistance protein [Jeotgalibacillus aurantiacus]|uniref:arsenic resistance protein n=1 Tax=Jeotgalibacillus aurantiacus TaxID=2763266 RepID=UPI001D09FA90|nr:bile acid:sodium symporter [Jeotgalibacillus aurantiacus]